MNLYRVHTEDQKILLIAPSAEDAVHAGAELLDVQHWHIRKIIVIQNDIFCLGLQQMEQEIGKLRRELKESRYREETSARFRKGWDYLTRTLINMTGQVSKKRVMAAIEEARNIQ